MIKLLLRDPVAREDVERFARGEGFSRTYDTPWTNGHRTTNWRLGEDLLAFIAESTTGAALLIARGPGEEALGRRLGERFGVEMAAEALDTARRAGEPAQRIRTLGRLSLLVRDEDPVGDEVVSLLGERLLDASAPVRWAAFDAALAILPAKLDDAIAASARRYADMQPAAETWADRRRHDEEARAKQAAAQHKADRRARLAALAEGHRWPELHEAALAVIADEPQSVLGWKNRALALEGQGRNAAALVFMHGAAALAEADERTGLAEPIARIAARVGRPSDEIAEEIVNAALALHEKLDAADKDDELVEALRALVRMSTGAEAELSLALGIALQESFRKDAPEILARAVKLLPELPEAWYALAEARAQWKDRDDAAAAYHEALARLGAPAPRSPAAVRARRVYEAMRAGRPVTPIKVLGDLMSHHLSKGRHDRLLPVAEQVLALDREHAQAWQNRALALTFLNRHEEAIAAYVDAIAVLDRALAGREPSASDPRGLMHFNRACELARLGKKEEALADLRAAMRHDPKWGKKAREDDYFSTLWGDREFVLVASGRDGKTTTPEEVRGLIDRCMGLFYRGDGDEALEAGEEAIGAAEALGDPGLLSDALKTYGNALTYLRGPDEGIQKLRRAVELAEAAFASAPEKRSEARHLLGAAHHAARDYASAEAHYRKALDERVAGLGEGHWLLAKSYGDLARLESDQGRGAAQVAATIELGRRALQRFLATDPAGDDRFEALFDLATLSSNLGFVQLEAGAYDSALVALEEAAESLGAMVAAGRRPAESLTRNALRHAVKLGERAGDGPARARVDRLASRLFEILEPSPRVRAERLYWSQLRAGAHELVQAGTAEADIAAAMREALRGGEVPEPVRSHPAFQNLAIELATRLGRRGDVVLVAMALSTAMQGGSLDEALSQLEGLAVAEAQMSDEDVSDDDDDLGEDDEDDA
ncbi:tetratricopeptide repeat protein [Polyangium aurulentum]|uniref:tetratricopeptide repeat protein n=1 Tax=Polyangium aurulentum TaxID=2567896 RepID=UPI0010AE5D1D|nr:tetratricopeptide repeat protein [Polyangium aurulentum]UQA57299.1 tetratricopeptide repeat protein [Polyangium aurulentum]